MNCLKSYPAFFKPAATDDLIRLGSPFDGGYVLPERILTASKGLLSFGLGDDCSFEADFSRRAQCPVVCFDHTVTARFWLAGFARAAANTVLHLQPSRLGHVRRWLEYRRFCRRTDHRHVRLQIGYGSNGSITFSDAVRMAALDGDYFLKVDIEGWEYRILDEIASNATCMTGIVIEFHDIDLHEERISRFLEQLSSQMVLVHFHANSVTTHGPNGSCIVVEVTLMNRGLLRESEAPMEKRLPLPGIDAPNRPGDIDAPITFSQT